MTWLSDPASQDEEIAHSVKCGPPVLQPWYSQVISRYHKGAPWCCSGREERARERDGGGLSWGKASLYPQEYKNYFNMWSICKARHFYEEWCTWRAERSSCEKMAGKSDKSKKVHPCASFCISCSLQGAPQQIHLPPPSLGSSYDVHHCIHPQRKLSAPPLFPPVFAHCSSLLRCVHMHTNHLNLSSFYAFSSNRCTVCN